MTWSSELMTQLSPEAVSAILNLVCPDCGGRMGGRGKEFMCLGHCGRDWRCHWERAVNKTKAMRQLAARESDQLASGNSWVNDGRNHRPVTPFQLKP